MAARGRQTPNTSHFNAVIVRKHSHESMSMFHPTAFQRLTEIRDLLTRHIRLTHQPIQMPDPHVQNPESGTNNTPMFLNWSITSPEFSLHPSDHGSVVGRVEGIVPSTVDDQQPDTRLLPHVPVPSPVAFNESNTIETHHVHDVSSEEAPAYPLDLDLENSHFDPFAPALVQDFSMFMDSIPSLTYPFSLANQPLPVIVSDPKPPASAFSLETGGTAKDAGQGQERTGAAVTIPYAPSSLSDVATTQSSLSRFCSRLPSLEPEERPPPRHSPDGNAFRQRSADVFVSAECRQHILEELAAFPDSVESKFVLPSRHALSRLVAGYFGNFHDHYPFFHVPTLQLETINVELLLAIGALGARYTMESELGIELYRVARSVAMERINRCQTTRTNVALAAGEGEPSYSVTKSVGAIGHRVSGAGGNELSFVVQMMQTLLILIAVASWYKHEPAAADALSLRSTLHSIVLEAERASVHSQLRNDWKSWIQLETLKRTRLVVFCFFNIHTILFDLPPMMLTNELQLDLPCSEKEWRANSDQAWRDAREETGTDPHDFRDTYSSLFASTHRQILKAEGISALGGYALIHAIIQQIWLVRNGRIPVDGLSGSSLCKNEMRIFERALKRWTTFWELNKESSMDPLSPHGPLTFTSTALLRLAYIRLNLNLGPVRALSSWDPHVVAHSLHRSQGAERGDQLTRAALHCAHALSIPVKLGINYVARTQLMHWSNQHALCSLECAVLLAKWLESVTSPSVADVTAHEDRVLEFVAQLVAEDEYKTNYETVLDQKPKLSAKVVRLWAKLYQFKSVWQTINLIGESLTIYAELLEK